MQYKRKRAGLLKSALLGAATLGAISLAGTGVALAGPTPITAYGIGLTIYNYTCSNGSFSCTSGSTSQQALYSTIADVTGGTDSQVSGLASQSGIYSGPMSFDPSTATIGAFLSSSGGTTTGFTSSFLQKTLSSSKFNVTSLMDFKFTPTVNISGATIKHDDGISLYKSGDTSTNILSSGSAPTTANPTSVPTLMAGTSYDLIYVEANGLPAVLDAYASRDTSVVPEPGSLALLGTGLLGLGLVARRRRRRRKAA